MTARPDITLEPISLYGSEKWAAATLGLTMPKFRCAMQSLHTAGFPRPDDITGHYIKADVTAWVNNRRKVSDRVKMDHSGTTDGLNLDAIR